MVGVDAVEHTASPFHFKANDPNGALLPLIPHVPLLTTLSIHTELIGPAVKGTVGILESIKKNAPGVKRVVITSSVASIVHDKPRPSTGYLTFDEVSLSYTLQIASTNNYYFTHRGTGTPSRPDLSRSTA